MNAAPTDLFEAQVQIEAAKIAEQEVARILNDPERLRQIYLQKTEELAAAEKKIEMLEAQWRKYFDAEGYISAATVSSTLRIEYLAPNGKSLPMGRQYILDVFRLDGIVIHTPAGYRLSSEWEKSGRGITRLTVINDRIRSVALFNADGLKYLIKKYKADTRVWHSGTDRSLWHE